MMTYLKRSQERISGSSRISSQHEEIFDSINTTDDMLKKTIFLLISSLKTLSGMIHYSNDLEDIDYYIKTLEAYSGKLSSKSAEVIGILKRDLLDWQHHHTYQNDNKGFVNFDEKVDVRFASTLESKPGYLKSEFEFETEFDIEDEIIPEKFWPTEAGPTKQKRKRLENQWKFYMVCLFLQLLLVTFFTLLVFIFEEN